MGKRLQRTGTELELFVMQQCERALRSLPKAARCRVADWLQQSALDSEEKAPEKDPNQREIFGG